MIDIFFGPDLTQIPSKHRGEIAAGPVDIAVKVTALPSDAIGQGLLVTKQHSPAGELFQVSKERCGAGSCLRIRRARRYGSGIIDLLTHVVIGHSIRLFRVFLPVCTTDQPTNNRNCGHYM